MAFSSPLISPRKGILKRPKDLSPGVSETENASDNPQHEPTRKFLKKSTVSWKDIIETADVNDDDEVVDENMSLSKKENEFDLRRVIRCDEEGDGFRSRRSANECEGATSNDDTTAPSISSVSSPASRSKSASRASSSSWRRAIEARLYGHTGSQIGEGIPLQVSAPISRSTSRRRPPSPHPVVLGEENKPASSADNSTSSGRDSAGKISEDEKNKRSNDTSETKEDMMVFRSRRISLSPGPSEQVDEFGRESSVTESFARRRVARSEYLLSQTGAKKLLETRRSYNEEMSKQRRSRISPPPSPTRASSHGSLGSRKSGSEQGEPAEPMSRLTSSSHRGDVTEQDVPKEEKNNAISERRMRSNFAQKAYEKLEDSQMKPKETSPFKSSPVSSKIMNEELYHHREQSPAPSPLGRVRQTSGAYLEDSKQRRDSGDATTKRSTIFDKIRGDADFVDKESPRIVQVMSAGDSPRSVKEAAKQYEERFRKSDSEKSISHRFKPQMQEDVFIESMDSDEEMCIQRQEMAESRRISASKTPSEIPRKFAERNLDQLEEKDSRFKDSELADHQPSSHSLQGQQPSSRRLPPAPSFRSQLPANNRNSFRESMRNINIKSSKQDEQQRSQKLASTDGGYSDDKMGNKCQDKLSKDHHSLEPGFSSSTRSYRRENDHEKPCTTKGNHTEGEQLITHQFRMLDRFARGKMPTPMIDGLEMTRPSGVKQQTSDASELHETRCSIRASAGHMLRNTEEEIEEQWSTAYRRQENSVEFLSSSKESPKIRNSDQRKPIIDPVKFFQLDCDEESNDVDQHMQDTTVYSWKSEDNTEYSGRSLEMGPSIRSSPTINTTSLRSRIGQQVGSTPQTQQFRGAGETAAVRNTPAATFRTPPNPYSSNKMGDQGIQPHPHSSTEEDSANSSCPSTYHHQHKHDSPKANEIKPDWSQRQSQLPNKPPGPFYPRTGQHPSTRIADDLRKIATPEPTAARRHEPPSANFLSFARNQGFGQYMVRRPLKATNIAGHPETDWQDNEPAQAEEQVQDTGSKRDYAGGRNVLCKFLLSGPSEEEDESNQQNPSAVGDSSSQKAGPNGHNMNDRTLNRATQQQQQVVPSSSQPQQLRPRVVEGRRVGGIGTWRNYVRENPDPYGPAEAPTEETNRYPNANRIGDQNQPMQETAGLRTDPFLVQQKTYYASPSAKITYMGPNRKEIDRTAQSQGPPATRQMTLRGGSRIGNNPAINQRAKERSTLLDSFPAIDPYSLITREDAGDSTNNTAVTNNMDGPLPMGGPIRRPLNQPLARGRTMIPPHPHVIGNEETHGDEGFSARQGRNFNLTHQQTRDGLKSRQLDKPSASGDNRTDPASRNFGKDIEVQRNASSTSPQADRIMNSSGNNDDNNKQKKETRYGKEKRTALAEEHATEPAGNDKKSIWLSLFGLDGDQRVHGDGPASKSRSKKHSSKLGRGEAPGGGTGCSMARENGWHCFNPMNFLSSLVSLRPDFPGTIAQ